MTDSLSLRWTYDRAELIADGVVHVLSVAFALVAAAVLIVYVSMAGSTGDRAAAWIYGLGLVLAFSASASYNIWPVSPTKWILRRFDHSAIFVLIAATYTPFLEQGADETLVRVMLFAIWIVAGLGIALKCLYPGRYDRLAIALYLAMGWSGLIVAGPIAQHIPLTSGLLIIIGGIIYSLGVIFHVWEKLRFQNAIWHGFVLAAAAVHYAGVFTCFALTSAPV